MKMCNKPAKPASKRGMYTSPAVRSRVLLKRAQGYTKSAIARQERIHRNTVRKILSEAEASQAVEQTRRDFRGNSDKALGTILYHIDVKKDLKAAWDYLEAAGVIQRSSNGEGGGYRMVESESSYRKARRVSPFFEQALNHYLEMSEDWGLDLPQPQKSNGRQKQLPEPTEGE